MRALRVAATPPDQLPCDPTGQIRPQLQALHQNLAHHERPNTVLSWLNKDTASANLHDLATGQKDLSHNTLDQPPDSKPLQHLRSVLIATAALPPRDEHLTRLEHGLQVTLADHGDAEQKALLHGYAIWHVLHRRVLVADDGQHVDFHGWIGPPPIADLRSRENVPILHALGGYVERIVIRIYVPTSTITRSCAIHR